MATDQELMEMAAKAVGKTPIGERPFDEQLGLMVSSATSAYEWWNPRDNSGDSFDLAAALELDIMHRVVGGRRVEVLAAGGPLIKEFYEGDNAAPTRRAVLVAAAEVWTRKVARSQEWHQEKGRSER